MQATTKDTLGMLVLRVWSEADQGRLRARITDSSDVFSGEQQTLAAGGIDEICAVVRRWLELLEQSSVTNT